MHKYTGALDAFAMTLGDIDILEGLRGPPIAQIVSSVFKLLENLDSMNII